MSARNANRKKAATAAETRGIEDIMGHTRDAKYVLYDAIEARRKGGAEIRTREHKSGFPAITVLIDGRAAYLTDCLSLEDWHRERNGLKHFIVDSKELRYPYGVNAKDEAGAKLEVERIIGRPIKTAEVTAG